MVQTEFYNFAEWLPGAAFHFVLMAVLLTVAAVVISFLVMAFRYGPSNGGDMTFRVAMTALAELAHTSPRRVWALARLAIQESLRRNVLVALGVFALLLLFGGWFLDTTSNDPSVLLLSFVLTGITWLSWALAVFLSAFSLPTDFKTHTIYTVVTKPVRSGEIVLGRILGFTIIGTVILALMGVASYIFALHCSAIRTKWMSPRCRPPARAREPKRPPAPRWPTATGIRSRFATGERRPTCATATGMSCRSTAWSAPATRW